MKPPIDRAVHLVAGRTETDHVRQRNRILVLSALRRLAPIARVDVGGATGLSPATITAITADLMDENLIEVVPEDSGEGDELPARRGRPRIMLRLDGGAGYVLGCKISVNSVSMVLADFAGSIRARSYPQPPPHENARQTLAPYLEREIRAFVAREGLALSQIAEVAIAAQGFVDVKSGSLMWSPAFEDRDIRLVQPLSDALGVSCTIFNDANMIAEALHSSDPETYGTDFAVVFVDYGVGMGLFVGGKLHEGADGSAAEFGHMNHLPGGPLCRCGRRGCIEAFAADYAIFREAEGMPPDTAPEAAVPSRGDLLALETAAYAGDARVRAIYEQAGAALGYGLARLMAIINPRRIVFTGASTRAFPLMEPGLKAAIEAGIVEDLRRFTVYETLPWDRDMIVTGLIASALARLDRNVFSSPTNAARFRVGAAVGAEA